MENNLHIISQEYPNFEFFLTLDRKWLVVCFPKHESPFGPLAAWVRVKDNIVHKSLEISNFAISDGFKS